MSTRIVITCDQCRTELDVFGWERIEWAEESATKNERWQKVTYTDEGHTYSEMRCPDCRLTPACLDADAETIREPVYA